MLSANEIECNNLRSRYKELRRQIADIRDENEVLHAQQSRMQAALSGFESEDNDVPHTMKTQVNELRTLKEEVRLHNIKIRKAEQKLLKKVQRIL
jgi:chromosome segregation ATPase